MISFDQTYVDAINSQFSVDLATLITDYDGKWRLPARGPTGIVFGFGDPPAVENVSTNVNSTDVIIPISTSLPAGTYQVSLNCATNLDYLMSHGRSRADEHVLDVAYPTPQIRSRSPSSPSSRMRGQHLLTQRTWGRSARPCRMSLGTLDPDNVPSAVDLYKFTLTPGQLWELGVSISTQSIDSHVAHHLEPVRLERRRCWRRATPAKDFPVTPTIPTSSPG